MKEYQDLIKYLDNLKNDEKLLEVFGEITVNERSWFRFVKYDDKVHAVANIGNNKLEEFGTYYFIEHRLAQWIVKTDF